MRGNIFEENLSGFEYIEADIDLSNALEKASKLLEKERVNMEDFVGIYSKEEIEGDLEYVRKRETEFSKEYENLDSSERKAHDIAKIFEAIFHQQTELSDWLGERAVTFKSSRYDDIKNGVDEIVKFGIDEDEDVSFSALSVDVTTGSRSLDSKFSRIKKEIDNGKLADIKYFYDSIKEEKKKLRNIPRFVIGVEQRKIKELMKLWLDGDKGKLEGHNIQFILLEEMRLQAQIYKDYAQQSGQTEAVLAYGNILKEVEDAISQKGEKFSLEEIENDAVFSEMKNYLDNFKTFKKEK